MSVPGVTTGGKRQREQDIYNEQRTRENPVDDAGECTANSIKRQKRNQRQQGKSDSRCSSIQETPTSDSHPI